MTDEITPITEAPSELRSPGTALDMNAMFQAAIEKGPDGVEALERLFALKERQDATDRKASCYADLALAQAEFPGVVKERAGGHSRKGTSGDGRTIVVGGYASLDDIMKAITPVLVKHGLSVSWDRIPEAEMGLVTIECVVRHRHGHEIRSRFMGVPDDGGKKNRIQQLASATTYGRRYSLVQALGITLLDEGDDDGQAAGRPASAPMTEEQYATLIGMLDSTGSDKGGFCRFFQIAKPGDLPANRYEEAIAILNKKANS